MNPVEQLQAKNQELVGRITNLYQKLQIAKIALLKLQNLNLMQMTQENSPRRIASEALRALN